MTSFIHGLIDFVGSHSYLAFFTVFLLALSEAIPVVGTVVPGSTTIIAISALGASASVNLWFLLIAATVGAICGDGVSYWLGRRYHRQILCAWPLNGYPQLVERSEAFIARFGVASVFLARFTAVVRAFVPLLAGILDMSARQFYAANIISALVWAPAHVFPGALLGFVARLGGASVEQLILLTLAGVILISAAWGFIRRPARDRSGRQGSWSSSCADSVDRDAV